jgi:hypothetical protein
MAVPPSMKNAPLTQAVAGDMGLGDQLKDDVQAQILERRKKLLKAGSMAGPMAQAMGPATSQLFPTAPGG